MTRKRERVTLGQKIMPVFFLCAGLLILSFGALIHFSGQQSNPRGLEYPIMMVGVVFVMVAVFVVLEARSPALREDGS